MYAAILTVIGIGLATVPEADPTIRDAQIVKVATTQPPTPPRPLSAPLGVPQTPCGRAIWQAVSLGWPLAELPELSRIVWRESRCLPEAYNGKDPNGGSYGLMQINGYWCTANSLHPRGYLARIGVHDCQQLFDPLVNLQAAYTIWQLSGWSPWAS